MAQIIVVDVSTWMCCYNGEKGRDISIFTSVAEICHDRDKIPSNKKATYPGTCIFNNDFVKIDN